MEKIRTAIIGVGNCASSLVQGIAHYTRYPDDTVGLMHPRIGPFAVSDIMFVAAFDVDRRKVGQPLHKAILAEPNRTIHIAAPLEYPIIVRRGETHDSIIEAMQREGFIDETEETSVDVAQILRDTKSQVVVNYLPTGSGIAARWYADQALAARCSFINCMPAPLAVDPDLHDRFRSAGLVLMGDDIKSQVGATIVNRALLELFHQRGVKITRSEQVNYGGGADHANLHHRPHSKEASKQAALESVIGPADARPTARMLYTPENYDHKRARIKIDGEGFGHAPISIDLTLEDEDSPNSAGIVIDAIRAAHYLVMQGRPGDAQILCAALMKSPPIKLGEAEAAAEFDRVIANSPRSFPSVSEFP